ncbi:hypothetical protein ACROYT_G019218 [Oculina patagonica]
MNHILKSTYLNSIQKLKEKKLDSYHCLASLKDYGPDYMSQTGPAGISCYRGIKLFKESENKIFNQQISAGVQRTDEGNSSWHHVTAAIMGDNFHTK